MIIFFSFLASIIVIALDQLTKYFFYLKVYGSIVGDVLWFDSKLNTGMAFSMFENAQTALIVIAVLASVIMICLICIKKYFSSKPEKILIGVILGGTISNLIDRFIFHGVRDFISLKFIDFPIFNIADVAITIGMIVFVIVFIVKNLKKDSKKDVADES